MTVTKLACTSDRARQSTYKHTGKACSMHKDNRLRFHPPLHIHTNICMAAEWPRELYRVTWSSVQLCESNMVLLPAQMATGLYAVLGLSGLLQRPIGNGCELRS